MIHIMLKFEKHYSKAQLTSRYKYVLGIEKKIGQTAAAYMSSHLHSFLKNFNSELEGLHLKD